MRSKAIATIGLSLLAAAGVALAAMIHGAGKFEWNGFYPWVIGPYVVLFGIYSFPLGQSDARASAGCITAVATLLFTCWAYIDAMWFSHSSTSALIFIFAPMYFFVGALIMWGLTWLIIASRLPKDSK